MLLLKTNDHDKLSRIAEHPGLIEEYYFCDLAKLNTLALIELEPRYSDWISLAPIIVNKDRGIVIFGIDPAGVVWMEINADRIADFGADANAIRAFARSNTSYAAYAIDTF